MRPSAGGARLTRRGVGFVVASAAAFVAAYTLGLRELLAVAILLAALPLLALLLARLRRPRLAVARTFHPHVVEAGTAAHVSLQLRNLGATRSARARWWDAVPWGTGRTAAAELPVLDARGSRRSTVALDYELRPPHRGVFPIGPLTVEIGDAFGLAVGTAVLGEPQDVVVTPEVIPLAETGLSLSAGDGESRLVQRRSAGDDDDAMTREYRSGDAMRRVHWRASARHGDLMVRQEEQRSFPEARILVDTRSIGYRDAADQEPDGEPFEWVVRMLASVAVHLRRNGFLVTIEETGPSQLESVGRGRRGWKDEEFLTGLASIQLTEAARSGAAVGTSNGPIVALVGSPDTETVDWILRRRRPGDVAVVFMVRAASSLDVLGRTFGLPSEIPAIGERFADAGWLVVPVRDDDDHASAWEAVVVETGRSRVDG